MMHLTLQSPFRIVATSLAARRVLPILLLLATGSGCAISEEREIEIGQQMAPQFEQQSGGLYGDQQVQQYVSRVGQSLVNFAGRQNLPWSFRVVDSDQINAFALPGGPVYITTGLLSRLESEAQLAAILGHEIGHVVERHSVQQIQRAQGAQFIPMLAGLFGGSAAGDVAGLVTQFSLMKYGRDQETESDLVGMEYMVRGGYDPRGMVEAMQVLREAGGEGPPEFFSTHPNPKNRIEYLTERVEKRYPSAAGNGVTGEDAYRQNVLSRIGGK